MSKKLSITVATALSIAAIFIFFRFTDLGTQTTWFISRSGSWLLPLVVISSLIDSINPCAFSILFLTIAFLFNLGRSRLEIFKIGGVYILGIFLIYILIGLGILQTLHLFNTPHFMAKVGALILIAWGSLSLINQIFPQFPLKLKIPSLAHNRLAVLVHQATLPAAFLLGVLVGLCEFPCTGGPYLMILGLLHDKTTFFSGLTYLVLYNLIFISPLLVILTLASEPSLHDKIKTWRKTNTTKMEIIGSLILITIGLLIIFL